MRTGIWVTQQLHNAAHYALMRHHGAATKNRAFVAIAVEGDAKAVLMTRDGGDWQIKRIYTADETPTTDCVEVLGVWNE